MFNNIVLAVDGSDYSAKALPYAKSMAERFESTIWLVHVFSNPSDFFGYADYEKLFAKRKGVRVKRFLMRRGRNWAPQRLL